MHLTALQTFYEFEIKEFKYYKLIFLLLLKYNIKEMTTNSIKSCSFYWTNKRNRKTNYKLRLASILTLFESTD